MSFKLLYASVLMISFSLHAASMEKEEKSSRELLKEIEKDFEKETDMDGLNKALKSAATNDDAVKLCKQFIHQKTASMDKYMRHEIAWDALSRWAREKGLSKRDRPSSLELEDDSDDEDSDDAESYEDFLERHENERRVNPRKFYEGLRSSVEPRLPQDMSFDFCLVQVITSNAALDNLKESLKKQTTLE